MNIDTISFLILEIGIAVAFIAVLVVFVLRIEIRLADFFKLKRKAGNPFISPTEGGEWNEVGTFNPSAILDDSGRVHMVYRAIGRDGASRFGYAYSEDGFTLGEKSPYPIFSMQNPRYGSEKHMEFNPNIYPSGGSWGGCEDPRMVRIGDRIYMTFNAFDGWDFIRVCLASIDENDFFHKKWKWSRPMVLSPAGQIHKNWVLFPEKINGKFALLHSIVPKIEIAFIESIESFGRMGKSVQSWCGPRDSLPPRKEWDTWVRSPGPPPIKTEKGWLVLYHVIEKKDRHRYKLGAMLLDLADPQKVIARSKGPVLAPDEWYENDWKAGVVYACGAVVKSGELIVYYGGGDKHVCVAHTSLADLLNSLVRTK
jgi:beta-1,2-mannobiose phosphorylase / 1,2-beta-oligomannan phosphorylase